MIIKPTHTGFKAFSFFPPAQQQQPEPRVWAEQQAGAEPGAAPAEPPRPETLNPPAKSFRGQALPRCRPFPPRRARVTHTLSVANGERCAPRPCPVHPITPAPRRHRTPESRSQAVVIAIQEAVQDAGEILRPQFLLFFALPWRPGETTRQRGSE